jgi:hypothetical protein
MNWRTTGDIVTMSNDAGDELGDWQTALLKQREKLDELRTQQLTSFDTALMTLSTGAIGASILLLQWMVTTTGAPKCLVLLAVAWGCFLIAILANLLSFQISALDVGSEIRNIDQEIRSGELKEPRRNHFRALGHVLNWVSFFSFTFGTTLLFFFAYTNAIGARGG